MQQRDVLRGVAVHDQEIGQATRLQLADLIAEALEDSCRGVRSGVDRLERAQAELVDENLHLARMPVPIRNR